MYSSVNKKCAKTALVYLVIAIFTALAGAVYELYSNGVYSFYMLYAFAYPLVGGTLPYLVMSLMGKEKPTGIAPQLYHCGIATLTVGSVMKGVLEIYGTTNAKTAFYTPVGVTLIALGILCFIYNEAKNKKTR